MKKDLHERNKHRDHYNFDQLTISCQELKEFVIVNQYHNQTIDFFNPRAVKLLNKALLKHHYGISYWDIPENYLCPPIPGRAEYIHHMADLLFDSQAGLIKKNIKCLDIGVGANCIYPIIGVKEYDWNFVATDIDPMALNSAQQIINNNTALKDKIELRLQKNSNDIFYGIIKRDEKFDLTICNPPFHSSLEEAKKSATRKLENLKAKKIWRPVLNFGGNSAELFCDGGEAKFISKMILQSEKFSDSSTWFSTLISKKTNVKVAYKLLERLNPILVKTIEMSHGNKVSRILAWKFN